MKISMVEHPLFYLGLSLILMHEMDAIRCKEWRIFPGLSLLSDEIAQIIFIFAHQPLFYFIFWQLSGSQNPEAFIKGFNIFLLVHLKLHIIFLKYKKMNLKTGFPGLL
jgi:hypothetical protein